MAENGPGDASQYDRFKQLARELGRDEDEAGLRGSATTGGAVRPGAQARAEEAEEPQEATI